MPYDSHMAGFVPNRDDEYDCSPSSTPCGESVPIHFDQTPGNVKSVSLSNYHERFIPDARGETWRSRLI
jgi:hypothetical protein